MTFPDCKNDGLIAWIAVVVGVVIVAVAKWCDTKDFGTIFVAAVLAFLIELSLISSPLDCFSTKKPKNMHIAKAVFCGLFTLLYLLAFLAKKM